MAIESRFVPMPIGEFLTIPPYQGQRRTEKHANRVYETLRDAPQETLLDVRIVEYTENPRGRREVLDGNSRQLLWETQKLPRPPVLEAKVYYLPDAAAARPLYESFNASISAKSARDETVSAMGLFGWSPKSSICRDATLRTPLCLAEGNVRGFTYMKGASQYELMPKWLKELKLFDEVTAAGITRGRTHSAITAAFLMTARAHGDVVLPFWRTWFSDGWMGERPGTPMNRLHGLMRPVDAEAKRRVVSKTGGTANYNLLRQIIYIFERWRRGDEYIETMRSPQITDYCQTGHLPSARRKRTADDDEDFEEARV